MTAAKSSLGPAALWATVVLGSAGAVAIVAICVTQTVVAVSHGQAPTALVAAQQITPGTMVTSGYDTATLVFSHLSTAVIWLTCAAVIAQALTQAALAALIALLAWRLLHGRPFRPSLVRYTATGGVVLLTGGVLAQGLGLLANGVAFTQINELPPTGAWPFFGKFDLSFIGIGVLLIRIAAAFRIGERMQHDTEGVV
jgi:hypothetical protein